MSNESADISSAILDRLCQRNVPDSEIDNLLDKARALAGLPREQLGKIESIAGAKKGNKEIEYHNSVLPSQNSISDKLEEIRMKVYCRESIINPTIDMKKLSDYVSYTAINGEERFVDEAEHKAYLASKLVNDAIKKNGVNQDIMMAVASIVKANTNLELWGATVAKKSKAFAENEIFFDVFKGNKSAFESKLPEFKKSLAHDVIDNADAGKSQIKYNDITHILSEIDMSPEEKLNAMQVYLDYGEKNIPDVMYSAMKNIAKQDSKYVPEIMNLLSHKKMDADHWEYHGYNYDYDAVLRTCLEQKPELITQELYNDVKNKLEASGVWEAHSHNGNGESFVPRYWIHGYSKESDAIAYMDSSNPNLEKQWQKNGRNRNNLGRSLQRE